MKLTQRTVAATKAPLSGHILLRDDEVTGFALRVTANGAKSFVWEGRIKGRPRRMTLGKYPDLTVLLARNKALALRSAVAAGGGPGPRASTRSQGAYLQEPRPRLLRAPREAAQAKLEGRRKPDKALRS